MVKRYGSRSLFPIDPYNLGSLALHKGKGPIALYKMKGKKDFRLWWILLVILLLLLFLFIANLSSSGSGSSIRTSYTRDDGFLKTTHTETTWGVGGKKKVSRVCPFWNRDC